MKLSSLITEAYRSAQCFCSVWKRTISIVHFNFFERLLFVISHSMPSTSLQKDSQEGLLLIWNFQIKDFRQFCIYMYITFLAPSSAADFVHGFFS